ncbi:hypothetical protein GCM10022419_093790 [Nonomuraea rosea]|uniref:Uncharacterized protein n=1 Tax=Nonomuraea rosea TaxID=638574 RepID=A0ABP6Z541_9ACTN
MVAVVALLSSATLTVVGVLIMVGVIHGVNGAGEDLPTLLNVVCGIAGTLLWGLCTASQVDDLRKGVWPDLSPSSKGPVTIGAVEFDADDVDDDW